MKRVLLLSAVCALMCACTMSNKNLLSEKIAKYPADKYITKIVSDADKKTAKNTALAELKTLFAVLPQYDGSALRRETILFYDLFAGMIQVTDWKGYLFNPRCFGGQY